MERYHSHATPCSLLPHCCMAAVALLLAVLLLIFVR
jgi:hypothetical protein